MPGFRCRFAVPVSIGMLLLCALRGEPCRAEDYHVSTAGDDAFAGTSPECAWRTIARANRQTLRPGDRILFQGGDAFEGNLAIRADGAPSAKSPITIGTYGKGKATIRAG